MRTILKTITASLFLSMLFTVSLWAKGTDDVIKEGVFAGPVELSGLTGEEAESAVEAYISELSSAPVTLNCVSTNTVSITPSEIDAVWGNREIIGEAVSLGRSGNIIRRFKDLSDLKKHKRVFDINITLDENALKRIMEERCSIYDTEPEDAKLIPGDGGFSIIEGRDGEKVDVEASIGEVRDFITKDLTPEGGTLDLVLDTVKPRGDTETLSKIKDKLGSYTTKYETSGADRSANIAAGCGHINGTLLYPGEQFSVYEHVSPFTEENGYHLAGSYLNGLVVESLGGGICQVSTTLYQAVLRAELQVDQRSNHSMVVDYVPHGGDAAIAGTAKDFKFTNNTDYPIYILGQTGGKAITFSIYGVDTRDKEHRSLEFESVELSREEPVGDKVIGDPTQNAGYVHTQSAHTGYRCEFWKIIKTDGVETDRVRINTSTYKAVPRTITLGTATDNAVTKAAIDNAIATQNGDYAKAVAASVQMGGGAGALAEQIAAGNPTAPPDEEAGAEEEQSLAEESKPEEQSEKHHEEEYRYDEEEEEDH